MQAIAHRRSRLFCPGPTPVASQALKAGLETNIYHRSQDFCESFLNCTKMLQSFFDSTEPPLMLSSSGTGVLEAALVNLTDIDDEVLVINGGKFGERWLKLCSKYQCKVREIEVLWGEAIEASKVIDTLKLYPNIKAVFVQANETSTGVAHPIEEIAAAIRSFNEDVLIIVDAVSALVAHHVKLNSWKLDCVVSGSQKGFGVPPGLAFIALSEQAWSRQSRRPRFYFDLNTERKAQLKGQSAWTSATTLTLQLEAALKQLVELGVDECESYHRQAAVATRKAVEALGFKLFSKSHHSQSLTAVDLGDKLDGKAFNLHCQNKYGAIFAGGQDQLQGKIVRIAHLGFFDRFDILDAIACFEFGLKDLGYPIALGKGLQAAMEVFAEH